MAVNLTLYSLYIDYTINNYNVTFKVIGVLFINVF